MKKDERLYLNDLSVKVYGKSNIWSKMVNKGELATLTEKLEDGTERKYKGINYYSVEEVKKLMEELHQEELELKAAQEKEAEEQQKERSEKAMDELVSESERLNLYETNEEKRDSVKEILETVES